MKNYFLQITRYLIIFFLLASFQLETSQVFATSFQETIQKQFTEYKGTVINRSNNNPLVSVHLAVEGTNISTVTNVDGEFSIKIPDDIQDVNIRISHLGFQTRRIPLEYFKQENVVIELQETTEELSEIALFTYTDAEALVRNMLKTRGTHYFSDPSTMKAFYRETIKRGRRNVSLSEAVVTIHKKPYTSSNDDDVSIVKARKTADYDRLDTLALKLRGGPYNPLSNDIMKNPTHIFQENDLSNFRFSFDAPTKINEQYLYVVDFEEKNQGYPWYYGKLYINAETFTLVKASFKLNVENRAAATRIFVQKKPGGTKVYPIDVQYDIEYRERDGRWYFGYGNTQLEFVVNWKRKLFNSRYRVNSELAVTDWTLSPESKFKKDSSYIDRKVVMADDVSGFADIGFWGENNIIEPDESIENAIDKIRNRLEEN